MFLSIRQNFLMGGRVTRFSAVTNSTHFSVTQHIPHNTAKSLQSCLTLCDPMDCSLPGSSVHGFSQARVLEWVAVSYSRGPSQPRDQTLISCVSYSGRPVTCCHSSGDGVRVQFYYLTVISSFSSLI